MSLAQIIASRNTVSSEDIHEKVARRQRELQAQHQAQGYQASQFTSTDDSRKFQAEFESMVAGNKLNGLMSELINAIAAGNTTIEVARRQFNDAIWAGRN